MAGSATATVPIRRRSRYSPLPMTDLRLLSDDLVHVGGDLRAERPAIDGLAALDLEQHVEQRLAARQAADMRGEKAVLRLYRWAARSYLSFPLRPS